MPRPQRSTSNRKRSPGNVRIGNGRAARGRRLRLRRSTVESKVHRVLKAIQERKIDRVAAAYAVAAWILVQAASIALPTFGAPVWVMKVVILAAAVGFPLALWITWHLAAPAHGMAEQANVSLRRTDMA